MPDGKVNCAVLPTLGNHRYGVRENFQSSIAVLEACAAAFVKPSARPMRLAAGAAAALANLDRSEIAVAGVSASCLPPFELDQMGHAKRYSVPEERET